MDLKELGKNWEQFAQTDPMWAILTVPGKEGGKWEPEPFFESGRRAVNRVIEELRSKGLPVGGGRALDFGCGLGRLTQALCEHFDEAHGVDIAPSMIEGARQHNRHGDRCIYHVNTAPDLRLFPDAHFDFILTLIVLQHMRPGYAQGYLKEFLRVLKPGGILVFQLPSEPTITPVTKPRVFVPMPVRRVYRAVRSAVRALIGRRQGAGPPRMEMYGVAKAEVVALLESSGGRVLDATADSLAGPQWRSYRYFVTKAAPESLPP